MPKAVQYKDSLICQYDITEDCFYNYTHSHFPTALMDEVSEKGSWIFGRKNDGYVALYSHKGFVRKKDGADAATELICPEKKNIWICQMGRKADDKSFAEFIAKMVNTKICLNNSELSYTNPRGEIMVVSFDGPLTVDGRDIPLSDYPRIDNPHIHSEYMSGIYRYGNGMIVDFNGNPD
jgi:hypothetical protein